MQIIDKSENWSKIQRNAKVFELELKALIINENKEQKYIKRKQIRNESKR